MANYARNRRDPVVGPRRRDPKNAGVAAVADNAGAARGGEEDHVQSLRQRHRSGGAPPRHKESRRNRRERHRRRGGGPEIEKHPRRVERIAPQTNADGSPNVDRRSRGSLLRARHGNRSRDSLRAKDIQESRRDGEEETSASYSRSGVDEIDVYNHIDVHNRQGGAAEASASEHRRDDRGVGGAGDVFDGGGARGEEASVGVGDEFGVCVYVSDVFQYWALPGLLGLQFGDISDEAEGGGGERERGGEQVDERDGFDVVLVAGVGDNVWGGVLSVRGGCGGGVGFRLLLLAGDERAEPGGDGGGFRQSR